MKKILSILLALAMLFSMAVCPAFAESLEVALPTATVTELDVAEIADPELTFAMNFVADEATDAQLAAYGSWYADYELTVNKDVTLNCNLGEGVDGYLAGQYDSWSEAWVSVPYGDDEVTLEAGVPLKIMQTAAALTGNGDLRYTYGEVYEYVQEFNCGMFLTDEFLAANPDLDVTLELCMYNPENESERYVIGGANTFTVELPTATVTELDVTEIADPELTFAMNFVADEATDAQLAAYGSWYADYELTVNKDVTLNCNLGDGVDGYLAGQYDSWSESWVKVPYGDDEVTLEAGVPLKIMQTAAALTGDDELRYTYGDVYEYVQEFNCGIFFTDEFLAENPDLDVTLELCMYNPEDESERYVIGGANTFTVELPTATVTELDVTKIADPKLTFAMNFVADEATDAQLATYGSWYADYELTVNKNVKLNCNLGDGVDGYLAGQYDSYSESWVKVPYGDDEVNLTAGVPLKIMQTAAALTGDDELRYTYGDVYEYVQEFNCGMFLTDEFLAENPDVEITLELCMYNPENESERYVIGETAEFTVTVVTPGEDTGTSVPVSGTVSNDSVIIKDVTISEPTDNVTIDTNDFVEEGEAVNTVSIPVATVNDANLSENATVEIVLAGDNDTKVVISSDALDAIKAEVESVDDGAENLYIVVEEQEHHELEGGQQTAVSSLENASVYTVSIVTDTGREVYSSENTENSETRTITVSVYYEKEGDGTVVVKHLKDNGRLENVNYTYSNNIVTMNLKHFSDYVIYTKPVSTGPAGGYASSSYTVKFDTNGAGTIKSQSLEAGEKVKEPAAPTKEGFEFAGWYTDKELTKEYDFDTEITKGFTLYAKWTEVAGSGSERPFDDVSEDAWFDEAVTFVYEKGIANGVAERIFAPDGKVTRGQFITMLCRAYGIEEMTGDNFDDCGETYYTGYLAAAKQLGISNGVGENKFAPEKEITREEMVTLIYNYLKSKGETGEEKQETAFDDDAEISEWAKSGVAFANEKGYVNGKTNNLFDPKGDATRAELAQIFFNIFK